MIVFQFYLFIFILFYYFCYHSFFIRQNFFKTKDAPESEDAMLLAVSEGIDKLFSIVRPRKLLMMAIDGVAPRAKMNQQRSRRFRSAQDAAEKRAIAEKVLERVREEGGPEPPETKPIWDSNAITPGTPFMDKVAKWLHFWVAEKISTDPGWRNVYHKIFGFSFWVVSNFFFFFSTHL